MFSEFFSFIISFRTLLVIRHRLLLLAVLIASSGCASQSLQGRNQDLIVSNEQSCWDTLRNAKGNENKLASVLDRETELLQTMVEELLASRAQTMRIVQKLKENMKEEAPMPPGLQNAMKKKDAKGAFPDRRFRGFHRSPFLLAAGRPRNGGGNGPGSCKRDHPTQGCHALPFGIIDAL